MGHHVRREFRDEVLRGVQREPPVAQLLDRELTGLPGSTGSRRQEGTEVADVAGVSGPVIGGFLIHVTQRG